MPVKYFIGVGAVNDRVVERFNLSSSGGLLLEFMYQPCMTSGNNLEKEFAAVPHSSFLGGLLEIAIHNCSNLPTGISPYIKVNMVCSHTRPKDAEVDLPLLLATLLLVPTLGYARRACCPRSRGFTGPAPGNKPHTSQFLRA